MFDDLMKTLQKTGLESVINNPQVPNEHNDGVLRSAGNSIADTLKNMMATGQSDQVAQLANNPSHPASQLMQNGFVKDIMGKFGISSDAANNIASSLIPGVLAKLGAGGSSSAGGFDLSSLTSSLGKMGLDKDKDGDVDLGDVKNMLGF